MIVFLNFNFLFFILCFPNFIYFFIHISFFFSPPHTYPYFFFSLFPSFLFFPTTPSTHVPLTFFFISFFCLFPYHFTIQNVPHSLQPSLIPQSLCIFFFLFFSWTVRKLQGREKMMMMKMKKMKMIET